MSSRIVTLGTSHTANNRLDTADHAYSASYGLMTWLGLRMKQSMDWVANLGYPGQNLLVVRSHMAEALAYNPRIVLIDGGGNDSKQGTDIPTIKGRMNDIINDIVSTGAIAVWWLIPPSNLGTAQESANAVELNEWLTARSSVVPGLYVLNSARCLADGAGNISSALSNDGSHLNAAGGYRAGADAYALFDRLVVGADRLPLAGVLSQVNITPNAMMVGSAGTRIGAGITGTVPDGWTVEELTVGAITAVCSVVPAAASDFDQCPWLQVAISTCDGAGSGLRISASDTTQVRWAPNDGFTYDSTGQVQIDPGFAGQWIQGLLRLSNAGGSGVFKSFDPYITNTPPVWPGEGISPLRDFVFRTWPTQANQTGVYRMQAGLDVKGVGTVRLRRCAARRTRPTP